MKPVCMFIFVFSCFAQMAVAERTAPVVPPYEVAGGAVGYDSPIQQTDRKFTAVAVGSNFYRSEFKGYSSYFASNKDQVSAEINVLKKCGKSSFNCFLFMRTRNRCAAAATGKTWTDGALTHVIYGGSGEDVLSAQDSAQQSCLSGSSQCLRSEISVSCLKQ